LHPEAGFSQGAKEENASGEVKGELVASTSDADEAADLLASLLLRPFASPSACLFERVYG